MAIVKLQAPIILPAAGTTVGGTGATMNLAAEESFVIGQLYFPAQTGSKTISSAGGRIFWVSASGVTFANAGTTLRIGIQDVATTGFPDGTFDVSADLVGATDTIGSSVLLNTAMEAGTKTIAYGATIAVGMEMISRAGVDVVTQDRVDLSSGVTSGGSQVAFPYGVHLAAKSTVIPQFLLKFDDGTYGWIYNAQLIWNTNNSAPAVITFGSGSTPDEYAGIIQFPVDVEICGIGASIGAVASGDNFELILYSDPMGTPAVIETIAPDSDFMSVTVSNIPYYGLLSTPRTLTANTKYGIALRPTTAATITWGYLDLTTGFDELKKAQPFTTIQMGSRTDQTGAFAETQVYHLPLITVGISGWNDTSGGGSGGGSFVF